LQIGIILFIKKETSPMTTYHWTPALERKFVECLADTGSVTEACKEVSMSRRAAYDHKRRGAGFAFRIGWDAAVLLARDVVADELLDRALAGQWTETVKDPETGRTRRFAQDRPLGLALLNRLDRMCHVQADEGSFHMAAQIVSQDFEAFLDLMSEDAVKSASVTDVRTFLSLRQEAWRVGDQLPSEDFVPTKAEVVAAEEAAIQCEVAENSTVSEAEPDQAYGALDCGRLQPTHMPFRPIGSNAVPSPGHPDYHRWIKLQDWARI
jgi:hypothetical protein